MDLFPAVVYQNAAVLIETEQEDADDVAVSLVNKGNTEAVFRQETFTENVATPNKWTATVTLPKTFPLGECEYHLWVDDVHKDSGTFTVVEGFDIDAANAKSPNEKRLEEVQKSIDKMIKTGIGAFGISGDFTTRVPLAQLKAERWHLQNLVNIERQNKGLPPLPGSKPHYHTYTFMG